MTVPVTLTVEPLGRPFFAALPGQLSYSMITGGLAPPAQSIQVRNGGAGKLQWTLGVSTADGGAWLQASVVSGTALSTVTLDMIPSNLPGGGATAGTFAGQLLFQSGTDSVTVPVSVKVGGTVFAQLNPISFTMLAGGADPLPQECRWRVRARTSISPGQEPR